MLRLLQETYPARVCAYIGYERALEHQLMAAADMLLMPSRYEPCGLPQMYALRYGTVPVVHATGGLKDSVMQLDERQLAFGTGFLFRGVDSSAALQGAVWRALTVYRSARAAWRALMVRCMRQDNSWEQSARRWASILSSTLRCPSYI